MKLFWFRNISVKVCLYRHQTLLPLNELNECFSNFLSTTVNIKEFFSLSITFFVHGEGLTFKLRKFRAFQMLLSKMSFNRGEGFHFKLRQLRAFQM